MIRFRYGALLGLAAALLLAGAAGQARAAATVNKFNLVISATPTQVDGGDFNEYVDFFNRTELEREGLASLESIEFSWLYDAQLHWFVQPDIALTAGVGTMRSTTRREYLPALQQTIEVLGEIRSVPIHAGALYYFSPYNQGDFQARAFVGGGVMSLVANQAKFLINQAGTDSLTTITPRSEPPLAIRDSPGWYGEAGVHMFFASRYSVMLGAHYRSARIKEMVDRRTGEPVLNPDGQPFELDLSGVGFRLGVAIGL